MILAVILGGCADPAAERAMREQEDARLAVLADAMFYWRCTHQPVVRAGECRQWSEAFDRDRSAFIAKYGTLK